MENRQEIKSTFNKVLQRQIPEVFRQSGSNIQVGTVVSFNTASRVAVVKLKVSGQIINSPRVSNQISILRTNDEVLILSVDANFTGRNFVIASFGGNYKDTVNAMES